MSNESQPEKTTIEFPCHGYHVSVVADTHDGFVTILEEIVTRHCDGYDAEGLRVIASKNGKYQSFRFSITAESEEQLKNLYEDLKATGHVHMVL
jgi:putative lipoic acid-binding regulatory protein